MTGVKGGVFDRNVARQDFEMPRVEGGDEPWVQQQDIPLSVAVKLAKEPPALPAPAPEPTESEQDAERDALADLTRSISDDLYHGA